MYWPESYTESPIPTFLHFGQCRSLSEGRGSAEIMCFLWVAWDHAKCPGKQNSNKGLDQRRVQLHLRKLDIQLSYVAKPIAARFLGHVT